MLKKLFEAVLKDGSSVTIDGKSFQGRTVQIINDRVIIDGIEQDGSLVGSVTITVQGDVDRMDATSGNVEVSGSCGNVKTMSGDVRCGDVTGDVGTMSGDVTCGEIGGSVKSMSGDIRMRR